MTTTSSYRADVDGLRAVAVLSVVLFHLHIPWLDGGYVGVDVFFVISGYLITGLIQSDLDRGSFTIRNFYLRRIRRLAPSLVVVTLAAAVTATLVLYPEDMRSFAASLAAQFVSLQNFFFLADGEYFRDADTKLLLHTWTLAVEEQFYLLWPLLLLVTRRWRSRNRLLLLGALIVVSFLVNLAFMRVSAKASFFLLPTRAWELGLGGVMALLERQGTFERTLTARRRLAAATVGLALVALAVVRFSSTTPFPGWAALAPVFGAALLVLAGIGGDHPFARLLANPWVVRVGLVSYPLYLWHWPIIAGLHLLHHDPSRPATAVAVVVASFVFAELTYRFVESPIRHRAWLASPRSLLAVAGAAAGALTAFAVQAYLSDGAAYRFSARARPFLEAPLRASGERCGIVFRASHPRSQVCSLRRDEAPSRRVLLWGNSHADMWSELFRELGAEHHASVYINARNCRATPDSAFCDRRVADGVLGFVAAEKITDVVLASSWFGAYGVPDSVLEKELANVVDEIVARGARCWLVIDTPAGPSFDPIAQFEANRREPQLGVVSLRDYAPVRDRERRLFDALAARSEQIAVLDPSRALCDARECPAGRAGDVWYRDTNHVTNAGARIAAPELLPIFTADAPRAQP